MKTVLIALLAALALAAAAQAEWTPTHPGDPTTCRYNTVDRPNYCGEIAAKVAFQAKYLRVKGRAFVGQLQCPKVATLTYMCRWGSDVEGIHTTVVRFAHKATGWKVAVGVIPAG